ncbi:annulin-like isoform X1 [Haliotis cracherodii]|uniref:annulin-like isoform X1 n=2 Tax=Haliotis cracherodii TaxID=6455 RepID=UPI0039E947C1
MWNRNVYSANSCSSRTGNQPVFTGSCSYTSGSSSTSTSYIMYSARFRGRNNNSVLSRRSRRMRRMNYSRSLRAYNSSRVRPRASERDEKFLPPADPSKEKEIIIRHQEETVPKKTEVEKVELETKLHVTAVDLHFDENAKEHHTDMYACAKESEGRHAELVLRRGQEFKMTITFDRPYDIKKNDITLMFNLGDEYKPNNRLNEKFRVDETGATKYKPKKWGATVISQEGNTLTLSVFVPATAPIGEWEFAIRTIVDVKDGKDQFWQYNHTEDYINIIFNPWCKEDWVYMEDDVWRTETVLNDNGTQYYGSYRKVGVRSWAYNQFNYGMLDAALHLVRKAFGFKATPAMASPVKVSRMIAGIVNAPDDGGVLVGNWSGDYSGGSKPTAWQGSEKILLEYMKTGKPVRYGQCWVFSAVTTAVCRAIGLPCRSVTNYASAHNTDQERLSIDVIKKNVNGDIEEIKDDSVWNFHVWNEVYMRRPDLNTDAIKYDGWHVIDATPQERSDGVFTCGPAPVVAIKEGHLNVGYDTSFIYAEVNADKVEWKSSNVVTKLVEKRRTRNAVGKKISTHQPTGKPYVSPSFGSFLFGNDNLEREDVTEFYKYEEGSEKEKTIHRCAEKQFRLMNGCEDESDSEHEVQCGSLAIEIDEMDDITVGSPFTFKVKVKNTCKKEDRTAKVSLKVLYKTYFDSVTGIAALKKFDETKIKADASQEFTITVDEHQANQRPQDDFNFELKAVAICTEDEDDIATEDMDFRMRRPDLELSGPATCGLLDTIKVDVSFTNPLTVALTRCSVSFAGGFDPAGTTKDTMKISNIGPGMSWNTTLNLRPQIQPRGQSMRALSIGFESKELSDITGKYSVELKN